MIVWVDEITKIIAETESDVDHPDWPDVYSRLGEANSVDAIANRFFDQHFEDEDFDDAVDSMPYFVVRPSRVDWMGRGAPPDGRASGIIEVTYFEHATQYPDEPEASWSENKKHREAHRYFAEFCDNLIESVTQRQVRSPYRLAFDVSLVTPPYRTPQTQRNPDDTNKDFFQISWDFQIRNSRG